MDSTPPPVEPSPPETTPIPRWRQALWILSVALAVAPVVWLAMALVMLQLSTLLDFLEHWVRGFATPVIIGVPTLAAAVGTWLFARAGLRRGWPARNGLLVGWGIGASVGAALTVGAIVLFVQTQKSSKTRALYGPIAQLAAADSQFFLENGYRVFVKFDELVGPNCYVKAVTPVDGEDYHTLFPHRCGALWSIVTPSGLQASYGADLEPAAKTDGVQVVRLPDGRRFEITYRGGVPDGPFRGYYADGALWSEATYVRGRVVGPAWLHTRDGRKFDELANGEAALKAVNESVANASLSARDRGLQKLRAKDYAGAIADLSRALAVNSLDAELHRARGDAKKATGDLDGAIADWCAAEGYSPEQAAGTMLPEHLSAAFLERGRQRQARGDTADAARDFRIVAQTAFWRAESLLIERNYTGALATLEAAVEVDPLAEFHGLRADAELGLNRLAAAEADCTRALELAAAPKMRLPVNRRIFTAEMHYKRGHLRRWLGRLPDAAGDFRAAAPVLGTNTLLNQDDAACWLFVVQCELGRRDDAVRELSAVNMAGWSDADAMCARFLLGTVTEEQLDAVVAKSNQDGDRLKANLYAGILRRLAGDDAGALARFRSAVKFTSHDDCAPHAARREARPALRAAAASAVARGDFPAAALLLKEAVALGGVVPADLFAECGDAQRGAKDLAGARTSYQSALRAAAGPGDETLATGLREKIVAIDAELGSAQAALSKPSGPAPQTKPPAAASPTAALRTAGLRKLAQNDLPGAIADFTAGLEKFPDATEFYLLRGDARRKLGEFEAAIADYTAAIAKPTSPGFASVCHYRRAHLERLQGDLPGAVDDFRLAATPDARLWHFVTASEQGKAETARATLADAIDRQPKPPLFGWHADLARFLLGRTTEEQLLARADSVTSKAQANFRFQALFYAAMRCQLAGDQAGAADRLRRAMLTPPNASSFEFEIAEARRLLGLADASLPTKS